MRTSADMKLEREEKLKALYQIREESGKFKLYFKKKNGFKFKQSFPKRWQAEGFADAYLRQSCIACMKKEQVYKTRHLGGVLRPKAPGTLIGKQTFCPECRKQYEVVSTSWRLRPTSL